MPATLLSIPILVGLLILQTTLVSHFKLLQGNPDLLLLAILAWTLQKRVTTGWQWAVVGGVCFSFASALPFGVHLLGYLLATGLVLLIRQRIWQIPLVTMFVVTFAATLLTQGIDVLALRLFGDPSSFSDALALVILPSILLNLLFSIPMFGILGEIAQLLHPEDLEV